MTNRTVKKNDKRLISAKLFILLAILLVFFFLDLQTGSVKISVKNFLSILFNQEQEKLRWIILNIRLPRVLTALLSGISLPLSGLLLQTFFSNPLAGPYILGISSGASLGVALLFLGASLFGYSFLTSGFSIALAGFGGAIILLIIILSIAIKIYNNLTILIAGIFLGSGIGAIVNLMQYFAPATKLKKFVIWTMGSLDGVSTDQLLYLAIPIIFSIIAIIFLAKYLDAMYLGTETATTLGIKTKRLRIIIFTLTGIMTGVTTAFCGPIGFIGIAVPHIARFILRTSKHLHLIVYSGIIGAIIMLGSDIIAHSFSAKIIPINTLTAIFGIPVIFAIVLRKQSM